jgi:hypothetical protein
MLCSITMAGTLLLFRPSLARAYRPFDGTDAGVAAADRLEVEFSPLGYVRVGSERLLVNPVLALTYGAGSGFDFGAEARRLMVMSPDGDGAEPKLDDVQLSAGKVLKSGSIQEREGVSIAVEGILLLPTTDENAFGVGSRLVVSRSWEDLALHLNGDISKSRTDNTGWFTSLIAEGPGWWGVRPVGEVSLEGEGEATALRALLLGVIWQTRSGLAMDFAIRTGYADEHQVELRSGITWNRHVAGPRI